VATFVGLHNRVYVGAVDLSGYANRVDFGPLTCAMQPSTTFNDGGFDCVLPGLISGEGLVAGVQDFASGGPDSVFTPAALGTQYPVTVVPNPTGTVTAGDAAWVSRALFGRSARTPMVGEVAQFEYQFPYDTAIVRALVAHPSAARTTDGNGTAVALTGPTASQKLYAALHVTAYSGLTDVVFKIQSDDSSGMASATDRITFTTVSGTTHQFASVAGSFSSETHHRITWDVTGSGSVTFVAAFGVI